MKLIDTNIFIYSVQPEYAYLRTLFAEEDVFYANVSKIEALGFHQLKAIHKSYFESAFEMVTPISLTHEVIEKAILLRQRRKMKLGDSIIGATALLHDLELYTRNTTDFDWISGIKLYNPMV
jgi:toxin FitB